jgi:hypothetical protein
MTSLRNVMGVSELQILGMNVIDIVALIRLVYPSANLLLLASMIRSRHLIKSGRRCNREKGKTRRGPPRDEAQLIQIIKSLIFDTDSIAPSRPCVECGGKIWGSLGFWWWRWTAVLDGSSNVEELSSPA